VSSGRAIGLRPSMLLVVLNAVALLACASISAPLLQCRTGKMQFRPSSLGTAARMLTRITSRWAPAREIGAVALVPQPPIQPIEIACVLSYQCTYSKLLPAPPSPAPLELVQQTGQCRLLIRQAMRSASKDSRLFDCHERLHMQVVQGAACGCERKGHLLRRLLNLLRTLSLV
jgi:hypothetical protein